MAIITIPAPFSRFTNNESPFECNGATVEDALEALVNKYPNIRSRILDQTGKIRPSVLIFIDKRDIRSLNGAQTPINKSTAISIMPAIAGG